MDINAIKRNIKRIEWFSVQFGYKLNTHYSINKSITRSIIKLIDTRDEYTISRVSAGNESSFSLYTYRIQENLSSCLEIFSIVPSKRTQIFPLPIHLPPLRSNLSPFEFLPTTFTRAIPKYASLVPNTAWEKQKTDPGGRKNVFF